MARKLITLQFLILVFCHYQACIDWWAVRLQRPSAREAPARLCLRAGDAHGMQAGSASGTLRTWWDLRWPMSSMQIEHAGSACPGVQPCLAFPARCPLTSDP